MEIILNLITLILGAFITATFTHFLHWCFGSPNDFEAKSGRIFSFYGVWLFDKYARREIEIEEKGVGLNWYKALGMCIYCFGAYIAFISLGVGFVVGWFKITAITKNTQVLEASLLIIIYPALCNFFLRKIK